MISEKDMDKAWKLRSKVENHIEECELIDALYEMADWKNEQIDTILHTVEGCLRSFFESRGNTQESIDNFIDALESQINKNLSEL